MNLLHISIFLNFVWLIKHEISIVNIKDHLFTRKSSTSQQEQGRDNIPATVVPLKQSLDEYSTENIDVTKFSTEETPSLHHHRRIMSKDTNTRPFQRMSNTDIKLMMNNEDGRNTIFPDKKRQQKERTLQAPTTPLRKRIENDNNFETVCVLESYENSTHSNTVKSPFSETTKNNYFRLSLTVFSDLYPEETSWTLSHSERGSSIIFDSSDDEKSLLTSGETLFSYKYVCNVSLDDKKDTSIKEACYDFTILDSGKDGICCLSGNGYYTLNLNDEDKPLVDGRFYSMSEKTSFCVKVENEEEIHDDTEIVEPVENIGSDGSVVSEPEPPVANRPTIDIEQQGDGGVEVIIADLESSANNVESEGSIVSEPEPPVPNRPTIDIEQQDDGGVEAIIMASENWNDDYDYDGPPMMDFSDVMASENWNDDYGSISLMSDDNTESEAPSMFSSSALTTNRLHYDYDYDGLPMMLSMFPSSASPTTFPSIAPTDNKVLKISKECLKDPCTCDSKPNLFTTKKDIDFQRQVLMNILSLSGSMSLLDENSAQYKAACWVFYDDPFLEMYHNQTEIEDPEKRMMQRYILAVHYFSTNPEYWVEPLHFLSAKSECEWNKARPYRTKTIKNGVDCDKHNTVISLKSYRNKNANAGIIVDEISGLKSLESIHFEQESFSHEIPSSFGRLTKLKSLTIMDTKINGTISNELFWAAKDLTCIKLSNNYLSGSLPSTVGLLNDLEILQLSGNSLTGEIPNELYSLPLLKQFYANDNMLSSTLSPRIGKLKELTNLQLNNNEFTNTLPSEIGELKKLSNIDLSKNSFSGSIPEAVTDLMKNDMTLRVFDNNFEGDISNKLCDEVNTTIETTADCRNDIFPPSLSCSCCKYCTDKTPLWNGLCPDSKLKVTIEHDIMLEYDKHDVLLQFDSESIQWSINDIHTNKAVLKDGPYTDGLALTTLYETCVAVSNCFSFNMMREGLSDYKTKYSLHWNDNLVLNDTFYMNTTEVMFQYNVGTDQVDFVSECTEKQIKCGNKLIELNHKKRIMYNQAIKVSGAPAFNGDDSLHSKALCWIIDDIPMYDDTDISELETLFTQRYVLTLLHLTSQDGLFSENEYPPDTTHECEWRGIQCSDNNVVTSLSITSEHHQQRIGGTLIEEIGSLVFLETLQLSNNDLKGSIPYSFSNLFSLRKLDLSKNTLTGSISENFFNQLEKLEYMSLANNHLSGSIPKNIGSHSRYINTILLNENRLSGQFPFEGFLRYELKLLDLSENRFSGSVSSLLLKHVNLENLSLGSNIFVGSLMDNIFEELSQLKFFNVSQNELQGSIPSRFPKNSDLTHLDIHDNRISGTIPENINVLQSLRHLNLQGNQLIGQIPASSLNKLQKLKVLALSHNQLIGTIGLDLNTSLPSLNKLYLHGNQLSGNAPIVMVGRTMDEYVADCEEVSCSSCSICCTDENGLCFENSSKTLEVRYSFFIFFSSVIVMVLIYKMSDRIKKVEFVNDYFASHVAYWRASELVGEKSVYHYFLTENKIGWVVGFLCAIAQIAVLYLFILAADVQNDENDVENTLTCAKNSLECTETKSLSPFGYLVFTLLLCTWLLRDIVGSIKLFLLSLWKRKIDFLFASAIILLVSVFSIATSVYYNMALATKSTELVVNAVVLLFVNELDERLYQLAERCNKQWVKSVTESFEKNYNHDDKKLILSCTYDKARNRVSDIWESVRNMRRSKSNNSDIKEPVEICIGDPFNQEGTRDHSDSENESNSCRL